MRASAAWLANDRFNLPQVSQVLFANRADG
jgi:hypothetical protein